MVANRKTLGINKKKTTNEENILVVWNRFFQDNFQISVTDDISLNQILSQVRS